MFWWSQWWKKLTRTGTAHLIFRADQELLDSLRLLAETEQRPQNEVAADLLNTALARRQSDDFCLYAWQQLTPREQQITVLLSRAYTNRQIAAELGLSPETIKTHVRNTLHKFQVRSRAELCQLLQGWNFDD